MIVKTVLQCSNKSGNKALLSIGKNTPLDLAFEWIIKNIDHLEDNTMIIKKLEA